MANSGENTNASQFLITTREDCDALDEKHTIFGEISEGLVGGGGGGGAEEVCKVHQTGYPGFVEKHPTSRFSFQKFDCAKKDIYAVLFHNLMTGFFLNLMKRFC